MPNLHTIIPAFNAAPALSRLLPQLSGERVVVTDGGSSDDTLAVAADHGARLAVGRSGRGAQLALGARLASLSGGKEDWFLFLHADSGLPEGWRDAVGRAMTEGHPRYFRFRADVPGLRGWWLDRMVALRCRAWGLPYGDQGLLVSRTHYEQIGGYSDRPLFEDVEIVERLKAVARLKPLPVPLTTDVSKHLERGIWRRGLRNLGLLRAYRRGADSATLLERYRS